MDTAGTRFWIQVHAVWGRKVWWGDRQAVFFFRNCQVRCCENLRWAALHVLLFISNRRERESINSFLSDWKKKSAQTGCVFFFFSVLGWAVILLVNYLLILRFFNSNLTIFLNVRKCSNCRLLRLQFSWQSVLVNLREPCFLFCLEKNISTNNITVFFFFVILEFVHSFFYFLFAFFFLINWFWRL